MYCTASVNDPEGACEQVIFRYILNPYLGIFLCSYTWPAFSGGGFSDVFAMPDYQADAVTDFFQKFPPPFTSAQFNNSGKVSFPASDI